MVDSTRMRHWLARMALATTVLIGLLSATSAGARESVHLKASLTPNRLRAETTIGFDFTISASSGQVPSPLTGVALRYPGDVGIVVSGLGLDACSATTLHLLGPAGCPAEARMGTGSATVEIPLGHTIVREATSLAIERAETRNERFALTFFAEGESPIVAQLSLPALLLSAQTPFGGSVSIEPPLVPSVPEAPDVSVVQLHAEIGPEHLTYYRRVSAREVAGPSRSRSPSSTARAPRRAPRCAAHPSLRQDLLASGGAAADHLSCSRSRFSILTPRSPMWSPRDG
jgi:hypothetical protein